MFLKTCLKRQPAENPPFQTLAGKSLQTAFHIITHSFGLNGIRYWPRETPDYVCVNTFGPSQTETTIGTLLIDMGTT